MRTLGVAALALTALLAIPTPVAARPVKTCWPRGSATVKLSRTIRIFRVSSQDIVRYYACDLKRRKRIGLGETDEFYSGPGHLRIAGNIVGSVTINEADGQTRDGGYFTSSIYVASPSGSLSRGVDFAGTVSEFALFPNGIATWIGRRGDNNVVELHVWDGQSDRTLDAGGSLRSLAIAEPDTIYWMHNGTAHGTKVS
jgi:hypothetical protein